MSSSAWPCAIEPRLELRGERAHGQRGPELRREVEGDPEILAVERDLEPERVVVGEHPAAPVGEDPALRGTAAERLDDLLDVEAGPDREDDALGDAEVGAGEDDLVDRLDRLPGADRPDVRDGLAHRREDRPGAFDVLGIAADEDRQRRLLGALAAAGDGRIDHRDPALAETSREVPAARRRDRRAVDDERALPGAVDDAVGAEQDGLDVGGVRDADHRDVDVGDRRRRRRGQGDAELGELGRRDPGSGSSRSRRSPARARLAAIAAPIVPRPRKATRVGSVNRSPCNGATAGEA